MTDPHPSEALTGPTEQRTVELLRRWFTATNLLRAPAPGAVVTGHDVMRALMGADVTDQPSSADRQELADRELWAFLHLGAVLAGRATQKATDPGVADRGYGDATLEVDGDIDEAPPLERAVARLLPAGANLDTEAVTSLALAYVDADPNGALGDLVVELVCVFATAWDGDPLPVT
jgi:hypothetical protein